MTPTFRIVAEGADITALINDRLLLLRPNPLNLQPDLFVPKARSYQERWPWLRILKPSAQG